MGGIESDVKSIRSHLRSVKKKHVASSATARGDDLGGWSGLPPASSGAGTKVEKSSGWIKSDDCPSIWRDLAIRNHGLIHMLRGFYHQQWWFDEEFHEGSMMVIPYVYSNHSNIYMCVYWGERNPHEHNLFWCEKGTGVNWPMAILVILLVVLATHIVCQHWFSALKPHD